MTFSSRAGQCKIFNPSIFTAVFGPQSCYEPAFQTPLNDVRSNEPMTYYNSQYTFNSNNFSSQLTPPNRDNRVGYDYFNPHNSFGSKLTYSGFDDRNSLWRREHGVVLGPVGPHYKNEEGVTCSATPLIITDDTGTQKVVCPIYQADKVQGRCNMAMNTVWNCERFKDSNPKAYEQCMAYQRMIHYDLVTPNGGFIPVAYEMTRAGYSAYQSALKKSMNQCTQAITAPYNNI